MSTNKYIDRICCLVFALILLATLVFINGDALGIEIAAREIGYETRLFNTECVHAINIVIDDWEGFLDTCENEEYTACNVVIDGEAYSNIGLRAKGNTSLSSVSQLGSDRYSFKLEFDQYDSGKSYHGLDKLCLNNLIQDNTYMKDYLTYRMMAAFNVDSPLCSYVYITVNDEDWGLYLAVEGVEDSFLQRSYGSDHGQLYKPDSMSFGGGRGNGMEFSMSEFMEQRGQGGDMQAPPDDFQPSAGGERQEARQNGGGFSPSATPGDFGGMGSADVKLQYIDDDPESYANIFSNAKTKISQSDQERLIASLQLLSSYEKLETVLDIEEILRYFVVHNFVVNGDSYTGSMIHNYYLYEEDGQFSMIPWDYNLAFGTFQTDSADNAVNDPIDEVLADRPMQAWIFSDDIYTEQYHTLFAEFLDAVDIDGLIDHAYTLIMPYVKKDPTKFCTYEEFERGAQALKAFCTLRTQSVRGQLDGDIPSTASAQKANGSALVDASQIILSDMGSMDRADGSPGERDGSSPGNPSPGNHPSAGQIPEDREEPWNDRNGFSPPNNSEISNPTAVHPMILLCISILFLAFGVVFAKRFRV